MLENEIIAAARRQAWTMVDLFGVEKAIEITDATLAYYKVRRESREITPATDNTDELDRLREMLVEIESQRGTATGMLVTTDQAGAHEAINVAEEHTRESGGLTPAIKHMYRAQRYWVDRIAGR